MIGGLWLVACAHHIAAPPALPLDLVVSGALTPSGPPAFVAIDHGVIVDISEVPDPSWRPRHTLSAPLITAGFVDAHAHPYGLGRLDSQLVLTDLPSYSATLAVIDEAAGSGWLVGRGWDQNDWSDAPNGGWPLATDLDAHTRGRPARLDRIDGHATWLNSAALAHSGIDASTPDPDGGRVVRDEQGRPTGVLIDAAMALIASPPHTTDQVRAWLDAAMAQMAASGLTGAHAMGVSDSTLAVYSDMASSAALPLRIWAYVEPRSQAAARLMSSGPWSVGHLRVVGVKAFADGALGSRGAWLSQPYSDEPEHRGTPIDSPQLIERWATQLLAKNAGLAVHAIGDDAVHYTLNAFAAARARHPDASARLRVEHAQLVRPEDRARFVTDGVVASMQPTHATSDMPWAADRVGTERLHWAYSWQTLSEHGALIAFGSDVPVESHRPALGLWAAVHRTDLAGHPDGGWMPSERLTVEQAIAAFTVGAARAVAEPLLGELVVGAPADLTLWHPHSDTPWQPLATVVSGVVVYSVLEESQNSPNSSGVGRE